MSNWCHICGPVKHECPTVICAPCAFAPLIPDPYGDSPALSVSAKLVHEERALRADADDLIRSFWWPR